MRTKLFSRSVLFRRFTVFIAASALLASATLSAQESVDAAASSEVSAATDVNAQGADTTSDTSIQPVTPPPVQTPPPVNPAPVYPPPAIPQIFTQTPSAPESSAIPAPPVGQKRAGFAMELSFSIGKPLIAIDDDFIDFSTVNGGLFLGGKINRVIVGMGFGLTRFKHRSSYRNDGYVNSYGSSGYYYSSSGSSVSVENTYESSVTSFVFKPGVRFDLVRSRDEKVSLFGQIDFGAGTILYKEKYNGEEDNEDNDNEKYLLLDWDGGLGVRYFVHPQFAVSAFGGAMGSFYLEKDTEDDSKYSNHTIGVSAAFQLLGVF